MWLNSTAFLKGVAGASPSPYSISSMAGNSGRNLLDNRQFPDAA